MDAAPDNAPHCEYAQAVTAHARHYVELVEHYGPLLTGTGRPDGGSGQLEAVRTWQLELPNIYGALDSALEAGELPWLLPIARWLQLYLDMSGNALAIRESYAQLLDAAGRLASTELEVLARLALARVHFRLSSYAEGRAVLAGAFDLAVKLADTHASANCLVYLGNFEYHLGHMESAKVYYERALALSRLTDPVAASKALICLAIIEQELTNYDVSRACHAEALANLRQQGDAWGEASALSNLGNLEYSQGRLAPARALYQQAQEIRLRLHDRLGQAYSLINLANLELVDGGYAAAREQFLVALDLLRELGHRFGESMALHNLGAVAHRAGNSAEAREWLHAALTLRRATGDRRGEVSTLNNLGLVEFAAADYRLACDLNATAIAVALELGSKSSLAISIGITGAALAALTVWQPAAVALHGMRTAITALGHHLEADDEQVVNAGLARLAQALATGVIGADDLAEWTVQGQALELDRLARLTLDAARAVEAGQTTAH